LTAAHRVVTVASDQLALFELGVPVEVFGIDRPDLVDPWYEHVICSADPNPLRASSGITVNVDHGLDVLRKADTIIVAGWPMTRSTPPQTELLAGLNAAHKRGARLVSICSGAFVLAAAGLLDGRPATTHWMHAAELTRRYPSVRVNPDVLFVDDGSILTSAGTAGGIDLCLHLVRLDHGARIANAVARRMVVAPHRDGGQAQFIESPVGEIDDNNSLADLLPWMIEHLDQPLTIEELAERAMTSPRTFARRFNAVVGQTPHQWLLAQRVLLAQELLESTDDPIDAIAARCGFGAASALRIHFQRAVKASPNSYRRAFRPAVATSKLAV
jgi:transcriptional regulator GlxA family with amidase domain